jgi:hypothetical protein
MAKILPFEFPELPFSLLLSTVLCSPLATLSAALCLTDLLMICWRIYSSRYHPASSKRELWYVCGVLKLIVHFVDTKWFYYLPSSLEKPHNLGDFIFSIWFFIGIYTIGRSKIIMAHYPTLLSSSSSSSLSSSLNNLEAAVPEKSLLTKKSWGRSLSVLGSKLSIAFSFLSLVSGYGIWILMMYFLAFYNLVTVQFVWLLEMVVTGGRV